MPGRASSSPELSPPDRAAARLMLGARVRALRRRKQWTVARLADAIGIDKAHVSRIENNLKVPSVATMAHLAKALGVSIGHLIGETLDKSEIKLTRAAQLLQPAQAGEPALHHLVPLLHGAAVRSFEAFIVHPGPDAGQTEVRHGGQEMLYVLAGTMDVVFHSHTVRVTVGDCIHFPGHLQHRLCRVGRARAKALLVLSND